MTSLFEGRNSGTTSRVAEEVFSSGRYSFYPNDSRSCMLVLALLRILKWCLNFCITDYESFWYRTTERTELKWAACLTQWLYDVKLLCCPEKAGVTAKCLYLFYTWVGTCWKPMRKEECVPVLIAWLLDSFGYTSSFLRQVKTQHTPGTWWGGVGLCGGDKTSHWVVRVLLRVW